MGLFGHSVYWDLSVKFVIIIFIINIYFMQNEKVNN